MSDIHQNTGPVNTRYNKEDLTQQSTEIDGRIKRERLDKLQISSKKLKNV